MKSSSRLSLWFAALMLCSLFLATAQAAAPAKGRGATVVGAVVDKDGPVPGATVQITGGVLRGFAVTVTDADGAYRFENLPAGDYVVKVSLDGTNWIELKIQVGAGKKLQVAPISLIVEQVEVKSTAEKMVKTETTSAGQTFQAQKLEELPVARDYTEVIKITPGVSGDDGSGGQSVYGATGLESSYIIDGINTTSVESGRAGKQINFDIIDRIDVKTAGYEAEFGGAQGAVVDVQTKNGGNAFKGSLGFYLTPGYGSPEAQTTAFGTQTAKPDGREMSGSLGGYIVKDKLYFFGALSRKTDSRAANQQFAELLGTEQQAVRSIAESTDRQDLYFLKLNWHINDYHKLTASIFADPREQVLRDELGGPGGDRTATSGGKDSSLLYSWIISPTIYVEGQAGFHTETNDVTPTDQQQAANPIGVDRLHSAPSLRVRLTSGPNTAGEPSLKYGPYAYSGDTNGKRTFGRASLVGVFGDHAVKAGVGYEHSDYNQSLDYGWGTGMALEWASGGSTRVATTNVSEDILGVRRCWGDGLGDCRPWNDQVSAHGANDTDILFAQDHWTPNGRLTLNYGLRWEIQTIKDEAGHQVARINDNVAPRLGVLWDVLGGGRSKLFASLGRYYDVVPMQAVSRAFAPRIVSTKLYRVRDWSYLDFLQSIRDPGRGICAQNAYQPTPGDGVYTCWDFETGPADTSVHTDQGVGSAQQQYMKPVNVVDGGSNFRAPVDPNLKGAHSDEYQLGFEWEFKQGWSAGFKVIDRDLKKAIEDISLDFGKNFIIANPGGPYRFYVDPANTDLWGTAENPGFAQLAGCQPGAVCTLSNDDLVRLGYGAIPKATRRFRGYEFSFNARASSSFWFNFSYLHSKTSGNYRGRYFVESEERDPNITEAFDVPALVVNTDGPLPQDRTHQVKVLGNYRVTDAFSVGATYRYSSGTPVNATTDPTGGTTPFFGPIFLLPRGSAGRTPSLTNLDLSLSYDIKDFNKVKVSLFLDVFNALNEQKPTMVDDQFLASGQYRGVVPLFTGGVRYNEQGRGEPLPEYLDQVFGDGNGTVSSAEWNRWAQSFQGAFSSPQQLYDFLRTQSFTLQTSGGGQYVVPAYPGFSDPNLCPASLDAARTLGCPGLNRGWGQSRMLENPRSVRFGVKVSF